uniref:Uncharacterized protein n=1 Tax=Oryza brachyantha TaxID=4533 RepID=J3M5I2_ORYBR
MPVTAAPPPKKKIPKSSEANRDSRDKLLKLNAMQQPALAFAAAAAAAAAASSMPLSIPSSRDDKKPRKQEAQAVSLEGQVQRLNLSWELQVSQWSKLVTQNMDALFRPSSLRYAPPLSLERNVGIDRNKIVFDKYSR